MTIHIYCSCDADMVFVATGTQNVLLLPKGFVILKPVPFNGLEERGEKASLAHRADLSMPGKSELYVNQVSRLLGLVLH